MCNSIQSDNLLIGRIRQGEADAWGELIARFEGRLLAFVRNRTRNLAAAEDVVQETFIGLLTSLPNYDQRRSLESYLFSIAAHKLTDHLRREGRRPVVPLTPSSTRTSRWEQAGGARLPSSIVRSDERRQLEDTALAKAMSKQIDRWRQQGQWQKLECLELLLVRGCTNKEVAARLGISEQAVANQKHQFLAALRGAVRKQQLPEDVFPELYKKE